MYNTCYQLPSYNIAISVIGFKTIVDILTDTYLSIPVLNVKVSAGWFKKSVFL